MPSRKISLATSEIYHVYNRGIDKRTTFEDKRSYHRASETIKYYRYKFPPVKFSRYIKMNDSDRKSVNNKLAGCEKLVEIYCYCLMPNHFHLLVRQLSDAGTSKFMSQFLNSYTKYFNKRYNRQGSIFLNQFKAVRIEDDEQFVHVTRYIHLNPYTSYVVKTLQELEEYNWSSFKDYVSERDSYCDVSLLLSFFKDRESYKKFVLDHSDYQRKLDEIKHLVFDS